MHEESTETGRKILVHEGEIVYGPYDITQRLRDIISNAIKKKDGV